MKNKRHFSGQSIVEYAIIFPVLCFRITGFIDLGRAVFYYSSLTNAVREATRYAIVHKDELDAAYNNPTNNSLQDKVMEYAFGLTTTSDPLTREDIVVSPEIIDDDYTKVSIQATYTFTPITPGLNLLFGSNGEIELIVQSKMQVAPGSK